jgi:hypothetical protein
MRAKLDVLGEAHHEDSPVRRAAVDGGIRQALLAFGLVVRAVDEDGQMVIRRRRSRRRLLADAMLCCPRSGLR